MGTGKTPGPQQFYGFELRNLKKSTNIKHNDSAKAIEDKINNIGHNRFMRNR